MKTWHSGHVMWAMMTYDYESLIRIGKWSPHHFVNSSPADSATGPVNVFKCKHRCKHRGKGDEINISYEPDYIDKQDHLFVHLCIHATCQCSQCTGGWKTGLPLCPHRFPMGYQELVLFITKTWLNPAIPDSAIQPGDSFAIYRSDRTKDSGKNKNEVCALWWLWIGVTVGMLKC